jgi:hypothetical protein
MYFIGVLVVIALNHYNEYKMKKLREIQIIDYQSKIDEIVKSYKTKK